MSFYQHKNKKRKYIEDEDTSLQSRIKNKHPRSRIYNQEHTIQDPLSRFDIKESFPMNQSMCRTS